MVNLKGGKSYILSKKESCKISKSYLLLLMPTKLLLLLMPTHCKKSTGKTSSFGRRLCMVNFSSVCTFLNV